MQSNENTFFPRRLAGKNEADHTEPDKSEADYTESAKSEPDQQDNDEAELNLHKKDKSEHTLRRRKKSKFLQLSFVLLIYTLLLNGLGCFVGFCDWYRSHIYGWLSDIYARITNLCPLPLGELCMYAGALVLVIWVLTLLLLLFFHRYTGYRRWAGGLSKLVFFLIVLTLNLYTIFWIIPIRSSPLPVTGSDTDSEKLTELGNIYAEMVNQCNELCEEVDRDEAGQIIYPEEEEMQERVIASMKKAGKTEPRLSGYYPRLKKALCSDVLNWMGIGGYTYPYTMEITYNKYVDKLYRMNLFAHELAHHKGYYLEDEGVYISYITGINSGDALVEYSAYTSVINYVVNDLNTALLATMTEEEIQTFAEKLPSVKNQVVLDMNASREAATEAYEEDDHPLEQYEDTAEDAADTGWSVQENILKEYSYSGVVRLLLEYYKDKLG